MPTPLRVAFAAGAYTTVLDGVTLTSNRQVAHLVSNGVPVRVYAPTGGPTLVEPAGELVSVPSIPLPGTVYRVAAGLPPGVRRDLERFRPTLVHLATPDLLGAAVLDWATRRRVPAVATFHTHFGSYLRYYGVGFLEPLTYRYLRWFYGRCREVYVATESMADELRRRGLRANLVVRPFGVDAVNFSPAKRSNEWRQAHGLADDRVVLLFVGRLVWEKALAVWADVLNRLVAAGQPVRGVVVGEGPAGDALKARVPHAAFLGRLGGAELATAFASADVFLFPSASETFGCVTVEALASGLPCVVADATGSRDIVRHGVEGLVCPPGDVTAFAAAAGTLVDDPAARRRLASAAPARAAAFRWDAVLARTLADFRRVV